MKIRFVLATGAVAAAVLSLPVQAAELRMTACFHKNHDFVVALQKAFLEPINSKKGPVTVKYLGGPEVTPWQKQAQSLKRGNVDLIFCPAAYYSGDLAAARIPGAQNRSLEEIRANGGWDLMQKAWANGMNARILSWNFFQGQKFYLYTIFEPKLSKETGVDLAGVKMRATPLYRAFLTAMGATPVVIKPSEVYTSLERGLVQGLAWPWGSVGTYGWERFLKYRIEPDFFSASMLMIANLDKYKSLSKAERDALEVHARALEKAGDEVMVAQGHKDDAKLMAAGVKRFKLEGEYARAYLKTIYGAKWAENDAHKGKYAAVDVDYEELKSKVFEPVK